MHLDHLYLPVRVVFEGLSFGNHLVVPRIPSSQWSFARDRPAPQLSSHAGRHVLSSAFEVDPLRR
jgi:hypothetical protein